MAGPPQSVEVYRERLQALLRGREEILFAILFGSAIEGGPFRDLDVAVYADRTHLPADRDLDYSLDLTDELERAVAYPVDVRVVNDAPLGFRYNVSDGEPLVVYDEEAYFTFRERTWDEWLDFKPVALAYLREMK